MQTFNITFVVRPSKVNKQGEAPIEVSLIINGERTYINTNRKCKPSNFDAKRQLVKRDKDANEFLAVVKTKLLQCQTQLMKEGEEISSKTVKELYLNEGTFKKPYLLEEYKKHLGRILDKVNNGLTTNSPLKKHTVTYQNLSSFIKVEFNQDDIALDEINYSFIDNFFTHQRKTKSHNTALKDVERFRQIVLLAFNNGLIKMNPFTNWKQTKERVDVEFLTESEIAKIERKHFSIERLAKVRDVFIFACYTALAYVDLKSLTREDVCVDDNGNWWIFKSRQKTSVMSKIPLVPKAKAILEKYDYQLPVLSNQRYNSYLDEIADLCGINKRLHTHIARHSAATMFLNNGVPIEAVSKILGHTNTTQTNHYAKLLDSSIMDAVKNTKLFSM